MNTQILADLPTDEPIVAPHWGRLIWVLLLSLVIIGSSVAGLLAFLGASDEDASPWPLIAGGLGLIVYLEAVASAFDDLSPLGLVAAFLVVILLPTVIVGGMHDHWKLVLSVAAVLAVITVGGLLFHDAPHHHFDQTVGVY